MKARNNKIATYAVLAMLFVSQLASAQKKVELRPAKFVGIVILDGKKDYTYYALSEKSKTTLKVKGPGKLTVYARPRLENGATESRSFGIKYTIDEKVIKVKRIGKLLKSDKFSYKGKLEGAPTKAGKFVINIPPGSHKLSFFKNRTYQKVHARFVFKPEKKPSWKDLQPQDSLELVQLASAKSSKQRKYFRIDREKGFKFETTGKSRLRILVRTEFDYKMHLENDIRIAIKQDGKVIKTYKISSKRSSNMAYVNEKKLIPGTLQKIHVTIPEGKHNYEIIVKDRKKSAVIRVSEDQNGKKPLLASK